MSDPRDPTYWTAFDVETSGMLPEHALQPWSADSWMTSFATAKLGYSGDRLYTNVYPAPNRCIFPREPGLSPEEILEQDVLSFLQHIRASNHYILGWNVAFDAAWLVKMGHRDAVMGAKWLDAMLMWKHITRIPESDKVAANRKKYGLKEAVAEYFPKYAGYGDNIDFHSMARKDIKKRLMYNRLDAGLTHKLAGLFMHTLSQPGREKQLRSFLIECRSIPLVADHYVTGIHVDGVAGQKLGEAISQESVNLKAQLVELGATAETLASPKKLSELLYENWNLPIIKLTPKGAPSTDQESLYELSFKDGRAKLIKRHRELTTLKTKFVDKVMESCEYNSDGISHPTAIIHGTYTGRMTFASSILKNKAKRQTGFAIHQMKRAPEYRRIICAPEGYTLVEWDAAGQEYRWVAIESNDEVMLGLCEPGEEPHAYMGGQLSDEYTYRSLADAVGQGVAEAKALRQAGKVGNLSCQYRIGPKSLLSTARVKHGLDWDIGDSKKVYQTYHSTYSGVKQYWDRKIRSAQQNGYAETLAGRRVLIEGSWGGNQRWMLESAAINFPIQGVGADQKYLAMAAIKSLLTKYRGKFYFELHDGLYAIFPTKVAKKAAYEGRRMLSNLPYAKSWGFTPPIPLPWDMKLGPNWGDLKEYK